MTEIRRFRQMLSVPKRGTARLEFLSSTDRPAPRDATGPKSFVENVVRLRQAQKPEAGPVVKLTRHVNSTHFTSFHLKNLRDRASQTSAVSAAAADLSSFGTAASVPVVSCIP